MAIICQGAKFMSIVMRIEGALAKGDGVNRAVLEQSRNWMRINYCLGARPAMKKCAD